MKYSELLKTLKQVQSDVWALSSKLVNLTKPLQGLVRFTKKKHSVLRLDAYINSNLFYEKNNKVYEVLLFDLLITNGVPKMIANVN